MTEVEVVGFGRMARPLLELVQRVTGLETTFVTLIDWAAQEQEVRLALNTGPLKVPENSVVDWSDSMCRRVLLDGTGCSSDVGTDFPESNGASMGMRTFCAVPIVEGTATLGTICGASRRAVELTPDMLVTMRLVAEALAFQMTVQLENRAHRTRTERAEAMALADPLTGLPNRRAFSARLEEELARSGRRGTPLALLIMDVDEFKAVNDTYGHPGGDAVLLALGDVLRQVSRTGDVPARLGGDEFALLLPGSSTAGAEAVAARIAQEYRRTTGQLEMPSTLSIGVSSSEATPGPSLLATADKAMYRSKTNGRNRSAVWATAVSSDPAGSWTRQPIDRPPGRRHGEELWRQPVASALGRTSAVLSITSIIETRIGVMGEARALPVPRSRSGTKETTLDELGRRPNLT